MKKWSMRIKIQTKIAYAELRNGLCVCRNRLKLYMQNEEMFCAYAEIG